jgi:hypothetical protein
LPTQPAKVRESRATITLEDSKKIKTDEKEEVEPEIDYSKNGWLMSKQKAPVTPVAKQKHRCTC